MFSDSKKTKTPTEGIGNISFFCLMFNEPQAEFLFKGFPWKKNIYMGLKREREKYWERKRKSRVFTDNNLWKIIGSNKNKYCICLLFILIIFKEMFAGQEIEQCSVSSIYFARKHKFN